MKLEQFSSEDGLRVIGGEGGKGGSGGEDGEMRAPRDA